MGEEFMRVRMRNYLDRIMIWIMIRIRISVGFQVKIRTSMIGVKVKTRIRIRREKHTNVALWCYVGGCDRNMGKHQNTDFWLPIISRRRSYMQNTNKKN